MEHGDSQLARDVTVQKFAMGIFSGATVKRGKDWKWKDIDESQRRLRDLKIKKWTPETRRSVTADVQWPGPSKRPVAHRVGHKKVGSKCTKPASGGFYYKSHLPAVANIVTFVRCGHLIICPHCIKDWTNVQYVILS
ncbi:E3 ubiquitin-protein ligase mib2 [Bulinus truncatus]|nr:E3 ubiquitin-protein ligase mib2 [Bulinus truncatus]